MRGRKSDAAPNVNDSVLTPTVLRHVLARRSHKGADHAHRYGRNCCCAFTFASRMLSGARSPWSSGATWSSRSTGSPGSCWCYGGRRYARTERGPRKRGFPRSSGISRRSRSGRTCGTSRSRGARRPGRKSWPAGTSRTSRTPGARRASGSGCAHSAALKIAEAANSGGFFFDRR